MPLTASAAATEPPGFVRQVGDQLGFVLGAACHLVVDRRSLLGFSHHGVLRQAWVTSTTTRVVILAGRLDIVEARMSPEHDLPVEEHHRAGVRITNGDPGGYKDLYSRRAT